MKLATLILALTTAFSSAQTLTFSAADDAYTNQSSPNATNNSSSSLRLRTTQSVFLKFNVTSAGSAPIASAKLRLYCTDGSDFGGEAHQVTDNSWSETTLTWNNAPAASATVLSTLGAVSAGQWCEFDVKPAITGDGTFSFKILSTSTNVAIYTPDENAATTQRPQLVVTLAPNVMPLEVISAVTPYSRTASFFIANSAAVTSIAFEANKLGYTEGISPLSGTAKASVRMNAGAWVDLINSTPGLTVMEPEKSYGGIGGACDSVRVSLPVSSLPVVNGLNTIEFRFNGTDGITSGFRVLSLEVFAGTTPLLSANTFTDDNPALWTPPSSDINDINAGAALWAAQNSLLVPGTATPIIASCAMCHDKTGRDLKYFQYSNWSIIERSKAHGLDSTEAMQVASHIRALTTPAPASARPWNPPYQPGANIDSVPVSEWAAGAGLASVLDHEKEMLSTGMQAAADINNTAAREAGTLNLRTQPLAVQFPDWNSWLPIVHPADIWLSSSASPFITGDANNAYNTLRAALPGLPATSLPATIGAFDKGVRKYINLGSTSGGGDEGGGDWRTTNGTTVNAAAATSVGMEKAKLYLAKWMAVKHWEVMQEFGLEDKADDALPPSAQGERGESRGWPSTGQSVWANAPHMTATNKANFAGQTLVTGTYLSSSWYQLQMTLNPGMRQQVDTTPTDWQYQLIHLTRLRDYSGQPQALRYHQTIIKAAQARHNGVGPNAVTFAGDTKKYPYGWQMRFLHPSQIFADVDGDTRFFDDLNGYDVAQPDLRKKFLATQTKRFLDFVSTDAAFSSAAWPRRPLPLTWPTSGDDSHDYWFKLEPATLLPVAQPPVFVSGYQLFPQPNYQHLDAFYHLVPRLKGELLGFAPAGQPGYAEVVSPLNTWCKTMWTASPATWDARLNDAVVPAVTLISPTGNIPNSTTATFAVKVNEANDMAWVEFTLTAQASPFTVYKLGRDYVPEYSGDSASPRKYRVVANTTVIPSGTYTMTITVSDAAGNVAAPTFTKVK